jgi:hypothetical protein
MRRAEIGHHHIAGTYLLRYAQEGAWREDNRGMSNGDLVERATKLALGRQQRWISAVIGRIVGWQLRRPLPCSRLTL